MEQNDGEPSKRRFGNSLPTDDPDGTDRAVAELLTVFGKKHSLALLAMFAADPGPWRFDEIKEILEISPDTLSSRLSEFKELGLVSRQSYHENPPRVEYTATEDAEDLRPVFRQLYQWEEDRG
jgi:DNA-binding HxlR family transcriptional regulator